jgi:hypothetical protein
MEASRGVARRIVAVSSIDVYRACGVLHGTEEGPLEPVLSPRNRRYVVRSYRRICPPR